MSKTTLPVIALTLLGLAAGCVPNGQNTVDSAEDLEEITNNDFDGDGLVESNGVEVADTN